MNFSNQILFWYKNNQRDLPWRNIKNPYLIWISEIILQQTRVNQGYHYYLRFIERFPDVISLANAKEEDVLKLWQGLGYYSRARNIYHAALQIMNDYHGVFPSDYNDIIKLKGIGSYSASAIASFAFKQPYPVIDGNVLRVISRVYGITASVDKSSGKNQVKNILDTLIDHQYPDIFNQAIMELGAMLCSPKNPKCEICPLQSICFAFENKNPDQFPVKTKKIVLRSRYFYYFVIRDASQNNGHIYLNKRTNNDIWRNMYDFPLIESDKELDINAGILNSLEKFIATDQYEIINISKHYKHQLTHQTIFACFVLIETVTLLPQSTAYIRIPFIEINNYPLPKHIDNYLQDNMI